MRTSGGGWGDGVEETLVSTEGSSKLPFVLGPHYAALKSSHYAAVITALRVRCHQTVITFNEASKIKPLCDPLF